MSDRHEPEGTPPDEAESGILGDIERKTGTRSRILLRDLPDEHSPVLKVPPLGSTEAARDDGRYQIVGEVARGGVGIVFKGRDKDLGRDVALKVLRKDLAKHREIVQRFIEEAQIEGQLQHPGIAPVYGLGMQPDGRPYFAMKLVKGKTLTALLKDREDPARDRRRLVAIFEQVCHTVAYAHARGVIHRDLKPSNVLVGAYGEIQLVDWGFAKVLTQGGVADDRTPREATPTDTVIKTLRTAR